jgi:DNA replication and repair protein RecF
MFLDRILVTNFKNIASADLAFSKKINCISGNNGEGKTNLLDAIYYLSMTKSFFHFPDSFSILHGAASAAINGTYSMDDGTENKISIGLVGKKQQKDDSGNLEEKILKRNDKAYKKMSEHIGLLPIVMVSPSDVALVNSSGEERRKFVNALLSQVDKEYLSKIQNYYRLLAQRNKLLKSDSCQSDLLETLDFQMDENATYIYNKRKELCKNLSGPVTEFYKKLSGGKEEVRLRYISDMDKCGFKELMEKYLERDKIFKFTTAGIHKDDVAFEISETLEPQQSPDLPSNETPYYPIKRCGSQGQQKCFLIALKLAQFSIMKELNRGIAPVLLLDDVFDKLDMQRVEYLLGLVAGDSFGQIFITDSNKVRMGKLVRSMGSECSEFEVSGGAVTRIKAK